MVELVRADARHGPAIRATIHERFCDVIAHELGVPRDEIADTGQLQDLGVDRFDTLELLDTLEVALGVAIPDDAVGDLRTFGDVEALVCRCNRPATGTRRIRYRLPRPLRDDELAWARRQARRARLSLPTWLARVSENLELACDRRTRSEP